jgi:hypothetical protein
MCRVQTFGGPNRMGRFSRNILFALIVLGIALRVRQYAACPSYWYDEAYLLLNIFHKSFVELLGPLREDQAAPPLFLWLLRGLYRLGGGSEWWMRLPALTASVAGLLVMLPLADGGGLPSAPSAITPPSMPVKSNRMRLIF